MAGYDSSSSRDGRSARDQTLSHSGKGRGGCEYLSVIGALGESQQRGRIPQAVRICSLLRAVGSGRKAVGSRQEAGGRRQRAANAFYVSRKAGQLFGFTPTVLNLESAISDTPSRP